MRNNFSKLLFSFFLFVSVTFGLGLYFELFLPGMRSQLLGIFTSSEQTDFYYGVFEDSTAYGDPFFATMIDELKANKLDSIMYTNNTPNLTISDQKNFPIIAAPDWDTLKKTWFEDASVPATIEKAREIVGPEIDAIKSHTSLREYNLRDDATATYQEKLRLAIQVAEERDPSRTATAVYLKGKQGQRVYAHTKPEAFLTYNYPFRVSTPACDTHDEESNRQWMYSMRELTQEKPITDPLWVITQAHNTLAYSGGSSNLREATPPEMRLQHWIAVGEGAKGIFWFTYSTTDQPWQGLRDKPTLLNEVKTLANRMQIHKPILKNSYKVADLFQSPENHGYVSTFKHDGTGKLYVVAVNLNCSTQFVTIQSDYLNAQLRDVETNQTVGLGTAVSLQGGDGRMYEVINSSNKTAPVAQVNLVQNPSFESGTGNVFSNWTNNSALTRDTSTKFVGNSSLKIAGANGEINQTITLKPNTKYYLSYRVKGSNLSESKIGMNYYQSSPTVPSPYLTIFDVPKSGNHDWVKRIGYIETRSNYTNGRLVLFWSNMGSGTAWVDSVVLCEMNTPCEDRYLQEYESGIPTAPTATIGGSNPTSTPTKTPVPAATATPPSGQTVSAIPAIPINYASSVEQWWSSHPYNPQTTGQYIPVGGVVSNGPEVDVCNYKTGSQTAGIHEALAALPISGGTLKFRGECSPYIMTGPLRWTANQYPQDYNWVNGGMQSEVIRRGSVHFVSDTGATIRGSMHITSVAYKDGGDAGRQDPERNFYFKNLTFERTDGNKLFFIFDDVKDVLFDNVTFNNSGMLTILSNDNFAFRHTRFIGGPGIAFDGNHGLVMMNSTFENNVGVPNIYGNNTGFQFHQNNDGTYDWNNNGQLDKNEQRQAKYLVFSGNTLRGTFLTGYSLIVGAIRNVIFEKNRIETPITYPVHALADTRQPPNFGIWYEYADYSIKNNIVEKATNLFKFSVSNTSIKYGGYSVMNNFVRQVNSLIDEGGAISITPRTASNNCYNGKLNGTGSACDESIANLENLTPTPASTVVPNPEYCSADINQSGFVDLSDYSLLTADFFATTLKNPRSDINRSGFVDLTDYSILVSQFFGTMGNGCVSLK